MMTVETIREQILAARKLLLAAEASSKAQDKIDALAAALEPFRDMPIPEFAEFLKLCEEYRTTGKVPEAAVKKSGSRSAKPKPDVAEVVARYVKELEGLYAIVHEETTGRGAITDLVSEIEKQPVEAVRKIAADFGLKLKANVAKKDAAKEIAKKLDQRKASAERNEPILEGWS
jgi:hypothetical protein